MPRKKIAPKRAVSKKKLPSTIPVSRKPRQDVRRARNREALLAAAIDVAINEGPGALTPLRITEQAGLHKRAFYSHFKDVGDCMQEIAKHVSEQNLSRSLLLHQSAFMGTPPDDDSVRAAIEDSLRMAQAYGRLNALFGRCRYDDSALGRTLRETLSAVYSAWTTILWDLALRYGVHTSHRIEVQYLAEHIVEYHMVAIARLIDGRDTDVAALAARMQRYNRAMVTTELRRMLGLKPIAGDGELLKRLT